MDTIRIHKGKTLMIAHRGARALELENTCPAFVAAGNRSYYGMETDLQRTLDGAFVCFHDATTGRLADVDLTIEETNLDTLLNLQLIDPDDTGTRCDHRIITLSEYVRICKRYGKVGVLEVASHFTALELVQIIECIKRENYLSGILFISFILENLIGIRTVLPDQPCQYLVSTFTDDLTDTLKTYSFDLDIEYHAVTQELISKLHENGIRVNAFTVDDPAEAERLVTWGIDYITTNALE